MQTAPLHRIDCMLLRKDSAPLPAAEIRALAETLLKGAGLAVADIGDAKTADETGFVVLSAGPWRVQIFQSPLALDGEMLKGALSQPYTRTIFPKAETVAREHVAYTWISLGRLPGADTLQKNGPRAEEGPPFTRSEEVLPAMSLVALIARELLSRHSCGAVYWAPSDHLLPPDVFASLAADSRPLLLNIRPQYFAGPDGNTLGMIAHGTQYLVGRLLIIDPSPLTPGQLHELAAHAVQHMLTTRKVPEEGETLAAADGHWKAAVRYDATEHIPGVPSLRLLPEIPSAAGSEAPAPHPSISETPSTTTPPASANATDTAAGTAGAGMALSDNTSANGTEAPRATTGTAEEDPDLAVLPPEVRESIYIRRQRRRQDLATSSGNDGATGLSLHVPGMIIAGVLVFAMALSMFLPGNGGNAPRHIALPDQNPRAATDLPGRGAKSPAAFSEGPVPDAAETFEKARDDIDTTWRNEADDFPAPPGGEEADEAFARMSAPETDSGISENERPGDEEPYDNVSGAETDTEDREEEKDIAREDPVERDDTADDLSDEVVSALED